MELGLHYPDTVLALKLLRNANLNKDEQSSVLVALQSRPGFSEIEDLLLQTMVCLNGLKESIVKIESQVSIYTNLYVYIYILYPNIANASK